MEKLNKAVVDGKTYEISDADFEQFNKILARSRVVASRRKSASAPEKEQLTDTVVVRLVGHNNVVYCNIEQDYAWNTNTYNGYEIYDQSLDTEKVKEFKAEMDKMPEFSGSYEMVATITTTINLHWAQLVKNPKYDPNGTEVVGNIIARNKKTGKLELYCGEYWISVDCYFYLVGAVNMGSYAFASRGNREFDFRKTLVAAHNESSK